MHTLDWPRSLPRRFTRRAAVRLPRTPTAMQLLDWRAEEYARDVARERDSYAGGFSQTFSECFFTNVADHTAVANTTAETSLFAGTNLQPTIPAEMFATINGSRGKAVSLILKGLLSTTGTPTIIFQVRLGSTAGATFLSGTSVGVSAAITTASGVTSKYWELRLDLICRTPGQGTTNATIAGAGLVTSPAGFATPFVYPLEPTTPDTATWTATLDGSVTQYVNASVTWSVASASNTIVLKHAQAFSWN